MLHLYYTMYILLYVAYVIVCITWYTIIMSYIKHDMYNIISALYNIIYTNYIYYNILWYIIYFKVNCKSWLYDMIHIIVYIDKIYKIMYSYNIHIITNIFKYI